MEHFTSNTVMLNLFQYNGHRSGASRVILKQVQDDEILWGMRI